MPKIDVVVPCYNYGRFLNSCVGSVLGQSVDDLRILIIDDASTDDSLAVATALAGADPRVSVIAHPRNKGHIKTYNEGIAWASADYFLLLSADDLLVPGALERAVEIMDEHPDVVLTHGECIPWYDDQPLPAIPTKPGYTWTRHDLLGEICATASNLVPTPTAIGRTSVQKTLGGYRDSLPHSGDMEMWLRFAASGSIARIDAVQGIYRKHAHAMSNTYFATLVSDYTQRQQAFDSFFDEYADLLTNSRALRALATRTMARQGFRCGIGLIRRGYVSDGRQLVRAAVDDVLRHFFRAWRPAARRNSPPHAEPPAPRLPELTGAIAGAEARHCNHRHEL
ncbi:glycosyltransferase family 2 protein [Bradyrhizobium sp. STM 3562]|uniref:glycosyltransferase family 2 protein n=1 Tax=Bradyrhizobium sp. STM 3562 TaxID=578924 RepID=UPI0038900B2D